MNLRQRNQCPQQAKIIRFALLFFFFVNLHPCAVFAGRGVFELGSLRSSDATIVLATIQDVATVERERRGDPQKKEFGFRFRLVFEEVLRRGQMPAEMSEFEMPFSLSGYATNWESGAKPANGMKAMAYIFPSKSEQSQVFSNSCFVSPLDDFDQPIVDQTRKICRLWQVRNPAKLLKLVLDGYRGNDPWAQMFCLRCLGDLSGSSTGVKLSGVIDPEMAHSIIFEPYALNNAISTDKALYCEHIFWNRFRGRGWEQNEPRYSLLSKTVDQVIANGEEIHHNLFDSMTKKLCSYSEHSRENYERLLRVINGTVDDYKFGAQIQLSDVYQPHTSDSQMQKLNQEVFDKLLELVAEEESSDGAAIAVGNIAIDYAAVGSVPEKFMKLLEDRTNIELSVRAKERLRDALKKVRSFPKLETAADVSVLAYPWESHIGKKIVVAADTRYADGLHGASAEVRHQRLWIDGHAKWPEDLRDGTQVFLSGRLKKVEDQAAFRYEVGKPFGDGLPVPEGYSLDKARTRYILVDAEWKVRKTSE